MRPHSLKKVLNTVVAVTFASNQLVLPAAFSADPISTMPAPVRTVTPTQPASPAPQTSPAPEFQDPAQPLSAATSTLPSNAIQTQSNPNFYYALERDGAWLPYRLVLYKKEGNTITSQSLLYGAFNTYAYDHKVDVSPDGKTLIFAERTAVNVVFNGIPRFGHFEEKIYIRRLDNAILRTVITEQDGNASHLTEPIIRSILFEGNFATIQSSENAYRVDLQDLSVTQYLPHGYTVAPSNSNFAFRLVNEALSNVGLYLRDLRTGKEVRVGGGSTLRHLPSRYDVSPDGRIVVVGYHESGPILGSLSEIVFHRTEDLLQGDMRAVKQIAPADAKEIKFEGSNILIKATVRTASYPNPTTGIEEKTFIVPFAEIVSPVPPGAIFLKDVTLPNGTVLKLYRTGQGNGLGGSVNVIVHNTITNQLVTASIGQELPAFAQLVAVASPDSKYLIVGSALTRVLAIDLQSGTSRIAEMPLGALFTDTALVSGSFVNSTLAEVKLANGRIYYLDLAPVAINVTSLPQFVKRNEVLELYQKFLGRQPNAQELAAALQPGVSLDALRANTILNSDEYIFHQAYRDAAGREATDSEYFFRVWQRLQGVSREAIILEIFNQFKPNGLVLKSAKTYLDILNLYGNVLSRRPDQAGILGWMTVREQGTTLAQIHQAFLVSNELSSAVNSVITQKFLAVAKRLPTASELNAVRTAILQGWVTREWVVDSLLAPLNY